MFFFTLSNFLCLPAWRMRHSLPQLANPGAIQRRNPVQCVEGREGRGLPAFVGSIKDVCSL